MTRIVRRIAVAALAALVTAAGPAASERSAEVALRAAVEAETVSGDVDGAIRQYKALVETYARSDRPVAARALLRLADAYRKLGEAESTRVYERVIREFADQSDAVAAARARLGAAATATRTAGDRVVKTGPSTTWGDGRVSPDGRLISYTDWEHTGNLMVHDLRTGADRSLTTNRDWSVGNAYSSTFSPDGREVAYGWRAYGTSGAAGNVNELRVMNVDGSGVRRVHLNPDIDFYHPTDWSPDGRLLVVRVIRKDGSSQIALVGVRDGSFRALRSVGWRGPNKIFFSPDGKYLAYDLPANDSAGQRDVFVIATDASTEVRVVEHPADDVVMGWSPDGAGLLFASDRTGALGLWTVPVRGGRAQAAATLLKPDIGSVQSQGLSRQGTLYIVRDASTLSLQTAPFDAGTGTLAGPPVIENFRSGRPDWSADGRLIAYRTTGANGLPFISVRSLDTGTIRELRPALAYIREPQWLAGDSALVTFGRDFKGRGGIYRIDARSGSATLISDTSDISRVQVAPDGKKIYYKVGFFSPDPGPARYVERNLETGVVRDVLHRPAGAGHAELSPDGRWLAIVSQEGTARTSTVLLAPVSGGEPKRLLDVTPPASVDPFVGVLWTSDGAAVLVVKNLGDAAGTRELWRVPVEEGGARRLPLDMRGWAMDMGLRLHPAGDRLAFFTGREARDVWALEGLAMTVTMRETR